MNTNTLDCINIEKEKIKEYINIHCVIEIYSTRRFINIKKCVLLNTTGMHKCHWHSYIVLVI